MEVEDFENYQYFDEINAVIARGSVTDLQDAWQRSLTVANPNLGAIGRSMIEKRIPDIAKRLNLQPEHATINSLIEAQKFHNQEKILTNPTNLNSFLNNISEPEHKDQRPFLLKLVRYGKKFSDIKFLAKALYIFLLEENGNPTIERIVKSILFDTRLYLDSGYKNAIGEKLEDALLQWFAFFCVRRINTGPVNDGELVADRLKAKLDQTARKKFVAYYTGFLKQREEEQKTQEEEQKPERKERKPERKQPSSKGKEPEVRRRRRRLTPEEETESEEEL